MTALGRIEPSDSFRLNSFLMTIKRHLDALMKSESLKSYFGYTLITVTCHAIGD